MKTAIITTILLFLTSCTTFDPCNVQHLRQAQQEATAKLKKKGYTKEIAPYRVVVHKSGKALKQSKGLLGSRRVFGCCDSGPVITIHLCEECRGWVAVHEFKHAILFSNFLYTGHHQIIKNDYSWGPK